MTKLPTKQEADNDPLAALEKLLEIMQAYERKKSFAQPSESFSIYDMGVPTIKPDTSTALKQAVIEYENKIRAEWLEHGVIFTTDGKIIQEITGTQDTLVFNLTHEQEISAYNGVMTHNHPKGFTFSYEDIKTACELKLSEVRAVTKYCRHSMRFNGNWKNKFILQKAIDNTSDKANAMVKQLIKSDVVSATHLNYELDHQTWILVAQELGFTYVREKS